MSTTKEQKLTALRAARDRVALRWCKGSYVSRNGARCAVGALNYGVSTVTGVDFQLTSVRQANMNIKAWEQSVDLSINLENEIYQELRGRGPNWITIQSFNDNAKTTKADVLALFDKTIERLENS